MKILVVEPGPNFSVADVSRGWVDGLRSNGHEVVAFNLADRLGFYEQALLKIDDPTGQQAAHLAAQGLRAACYDFWPDLIVITSAFYVPPTTIDTIRSRGHRVAIIFTESPYEDDNQVKLAARADLCVINDPTNLDQFLAVNPNTIYIPHAYDPARHHPRPPNPAHQSDLVMVGTGYPSRIDFLQECDFDGIDVALAGNWTTLDEHSPLRKYVAHDIRHCCYNDEAVDLYTSAKASVNLYRTEAQRPGLSTGWAMGPREVELAACGTFYLTEPRGENREVLPMVPTFTTPAEFTDQLRWWLAHDIERSEIAAAARDAIKDRTFHNHARHLLERI